MKQVRLIFWLLVIGFLGLVFYQNQAYFLAKNSLHIDFWFKEITVPEIQNGLYFLGCFLFGLLLAYFYQIPERFRSGKTIKHLNATIASLKTEAAARGRVQTSVEPHSPPRVKPSTAVSGREDTGDSAELAGRAATSVEARPTSRDS